MARVEGLDDKHYTIERLEGVDGMFSSLGTPLMWPVSLLCRKFSGHFGMKHAEIGVASCLVYHHFP